MRRRTFLTLGNEGIDVSKAVACDICLYNKTTQKLVIVESSKFSASEYPSSNYSPVGVVVIPGSHDVYGDGSCAVMSLKNMSYETPDTGSTSSQAIYWGQYKVDISTLTNYTDVVSLGTLNSTPQTTVQGTKNYGRLPSDNGFTGYQCPHDTDTNYYGDTSSSYCYIPSPYLTDDTRNPMYYQTSSPSSTANAFSDFDGVGNTKILTDLAIKQTNWKTASTITNNGGSGYSPAACCCWRYHTEGTKQGDWYLPAMGELGYIMPKLKKINQAISTITTAYGSTVGVQVGDYLGYLSSSEYSTNLARYVDIAIGNVYYGNKDFDSFVRAFLRIGA